jgi:hypothetical protein
MARVRISTTVDDGLWAAALRLVGGPGSRVVDRALTALIQQLEREHEVEALASRPYEADGDLDWQAPFGPDLAYDAAVPADVSELVQRRRNP